MYTKECDHIHCSSVLLYFCDRTLTKATGGEKDVFHLALPNTGSLLKEARSETQGRNLDSGIETETMEECGLLACFP